MLLSLVMNSVQLKMNTIKSQIGQHLFLFTGAGRLRNQQGAFRGVFQKGVWVSEISKAHRTESLHTLTELIRCRAQPVEVSKAHRRTVRCISGIAITWLNPPSRSARAMCHSKPPNCEPASLFRHRVFHCMQSLHWSPLGAI